MGVGTGAYLAWGMGKHSGVTKTRKRFTCRLCGCMNLSKLFKLYQNLLQSYTLSWFKTSVLGMYQELL